MPMRHTQQSRRIYIEFYAIGGPQPACFRPSRSPDPNPRMQPSPAVMHAAAVHPNPNRHAALMPMAPRSSRRGLLEVIGGPLPASDTQA